MNKFAVVSLDDGLTQKKTNLSQHAAQSSFTLGADGIGGDYMEDFVGNIVDAGVQSGIQVSNATTRKYKEY